MDKHYTYGIVNDTTVILFNESTVSRSLLSSDFLDGVDVSIDDNGILTIIGKRIIYDLYIHGDRVFEDEWKHTPDKKLIKTGKRWPWSKKKEMYVNSGWVRTTAREDVIYILNNYKIEILK